MTNLLQQTEIYWTHPSDSITSIRLIWFFFFWIDNFQFHFTLFLCFKDILLPVNWGYCPYVFKFTHKNRFHPFWFWQNLKKNMYENRKRGLLCVMSRIWCLFKILWANRLVNLWVSYAGILSHFLGFVLILFPNVVRTSRGKIEIYKLP